MIILSSLLPVFLIIIVGLALAKGGFIDRRFQSDLNRLAYWVGLPCLIFHSISQARFGAGDSLRIFLVILAASIAAIIIGIPAARLFGARRAGRSAFIHAGFRGNLAFIALPVVVYANGGPSAAAHSTVVQVAVLAMAPMMIANNVFGVLVMLVDRHAFSWKTLRTTLRHLLTNPFLIACVAGLLVSYFRLALPSFLEYPIAAFGQMGVPVALLCIGGTLAANRISRSVLPVTGAALMKVLVTPLIGLAIARLAGITGSNLQTVLIALATPSAAVSYIMSVQMGGDESIASGAVVLSTVLSFFSLSAALILF